MGSHWRTDSATFRTFAGRCAQVITADGAVTGGAAKASPKQKAANEWREQKQRENPPNRDDTAETIGGVTKGGETIIFDAHKTVDLLDGRYIEAAMSAESETIRSIVQVFTAVPAKLRNVL